MISQIHIAGAAVTIYGSYVRSQYVAEGVESRFHPPVDDPAFQRVARSAGYTSHAFAEPAMQFGLEHELMHHFVAEFVLGLPHSRVIMYDARGHGDGQRRGWPFRGRDEEHLAVFMQTWLTTGQLPEPGHASLVEIVGGINLAGAIRNQALHLLYWSGLRKRRG